jgi:outer membrane lipoprotein-sorting protein
VKRFLSILALSSTFIHAESLEEVLTRMDQSAQEFRSVSAKMKRMQYTAVIDEKTDMEGVMRLRKGKGGTQGVVEFLPPEQRTVFIAGKNVQVYYPKANSVEIYDASKYVSNIDQFMLLGFGTSSTELNKAYTLKALGTEAIGGVQTTHIELTPKSMELKNLITKIELWIPAGQSNPIQEKVTEPSKNYELVTYSEIKVNPTLPDSAFELKLPSGVKKIYPQK